MIFFWLPQIFPYIYIPYIPWHADTAFCYHSTMIDLFYYCTRLITHVNGPLALLLADETLDDVKVWWLETST